MSDNQPNEQLIESVRVAFDIGELTELTMEQLYGGVRALLEENKRLQNDLKMETRDREAWEAEVQKLAEERHDLINEVDSLKDVRFELRTELSTKDKVLEWYGEESNHEMIDNKVSEYETETTSDVWQDSGLKARSILSQYRKSEDTHERDK